MFGIHCPYAFNTCLLYVLGTSTSPTSRAKPVMYYVYFKRIDSVIYYECMFLLFCADDCPGGASVWSPAAGALWRNGGESGNTSA